MFAAEGGILKPYVHYRFVNNSNKGNKPVSPLGVALHLLAKNKLYFIKLVTTSILTILS